MLITELNSVDYLKFIESVFRENRFKFLLLSVVRYGDNKKFYNELDEFWSSIDNVTAKKVAFLHFTYELDKNEISYIDIGSGERLLSLGFQQVSEFDILEHIENLSPTTRIKKEAIKYNFSNFYWVRYYNDMQNIKLKHLPRLKKNVCQSIDESATQLLKYLGKKEVDVPFLYLMDLNTNEKYFFSLNNIYAQYSSIYNFIRTIVIKIEEEENFSRESENIRTRISKIELSIKRRQQRLLSKQNQLKSVPKDMLDIETYLEKENLNDKQTYYLESITKRRKFELIFPLKKLFPNIYFNGTHINSIILKYAYKDLENLEVNLKNWIDFEIEELGKDIKKSQNLKQELNDQINFISNKLTFLYKEMISQKCQPNGRAIENFKVALTFAGENRGYVEQVAIDLEMKLGKGNVFYDNFFQAELARLDLDIFLQDIYHNKSDFIVVFLSKGYRSKEWCGLEWRSIRDLIRKKQSDKIILVKLEDFSIDGIFSIDGYLDGIINNPIRISDLINKRICA